MKKFKQEYKTAVEMYEQYKTDVVKVGIGLNINQIRILLLLENNIRELLPIKLKWYHKLIGAFNNRKN